MKKILPVFGTRPEAIKMAPLIHRLQEPTAGFDVRICVTAQHRELLDSALAFCGIVPDYDLNLMRPGQHPSELFAAVVSGMQKVLDICKPDCILVHGDTVTSAAAAQAACYARCRVGHVEAGLRTGNRHSPFPEEINRQLTARLADLHFVPTDRNRENLLREGIPPENIFTTGNTGIDALLQSVEKIASPGFSHPQIEKLKKRIGLSLPVVLVTGHRRENFGPGLENICRALHRIARETNAAIVCPVHPNPDVRKTVFGMLGETENICLTPPLDYPAFVWLMHRATVVLTDSGGVQEEAPAIGKPVLVLRDTTERPEAVEAGTARLVGTDPERIVRETLRLLNDPVHYRKIARKTSPFGDGHACERIVCILQKQ